MRERPTGIYFLTPVWGAPYTRLYINTIIPAQLAQGNLGAFQNQPGCRYIIYTTQEDAAAIRSSAIFGPLNACVPVTFEWINEKIGVVHDMMSACYRRGIDAANAAGAAVVFLTPDIVFADGSFAALKRLSDAGHDVVFIPAVRTLKQGVMMALKSRYVAGDKTQVQPRELMRVALDNLHSLADASLWNQGESNLVPANLYWPIGDEGFLGRCFHLHPVFVYPQKRNAKFFSTVDDDFCAVACPDSSKDYVVTDSDEFLAIELSDPSHNFSTSFRKGSIADTANWAEQYASERHRALFEHTIRMHSGIKNQAAWSEAAKDAASVAEAVKRRLTRPSSELLLAGDTAFVRRIIRLATDKRLTIENRSNNADLSRMRSVLHSFNILERWPYWLLRFYNSMIHTVLRRRNWYLGTFEHPRIYTRNFAAQNLMRQDLLQLVGTASEIMLICENAHESYMRTILGGTDLNVSVATFSKLRDGDAFVSLTGSETVDVLSYDLILVEQRRRDELRAIIELAYRTLRSNGRLLILTDRLGIRNALSDVQPYNREMMESVLQPHFSIVEQRTQGGIGMACYFEFSHWLEAVTRRRPILARLVELTLLWLPFYIAIGIVGPWLGSIIDRLDRKRTAWVSSLTLAIKVDGGVN